MLTNLSRCFGCFSTPVVHANRDASSAQKPDPVLPKKKQPTLDDSPPITFLSTENTRKVGNRFFKNKNFHDALDYYQQSLVLAESECSDKEKLLALNNLIITQIKQDPKSPNLSQFYKQLYTHFNQLRHTRPELFTEYRQKSTYRLFQAAQHMSQRQIADIVQSTIDSHDLTQFSQPRARVGLRNHKVFGLGLKSLAPIEAEQVVAVYAGEQWSEDCKKTLSDGGSMYFPNLIQDSHLSPSLNGRYTVGSRVPGAPWLAGALVNDGTLQDNVLERYQAFKANPTPQTLIAFKTIYNKNLDRNNCKIMYDDAAPNLGVHIKSTQPILKGQPLSVAYGADYWISKASFEFRAKGDFQTHMTVDGLIRNQTQTPKSFNLSKFKHNVGRVFITKNIAPLLDDFVTTIPSIMDRFLSASIINPSLDYTVDIVYNHQLSNWKEILKSQCEGFTFIDALERQAKDEFDLKNMLPPGFSEILGGNEAEFGALMSGFGFGEQQLKELFFKACLFIVAVRQFDQVDQFPSPVVMRLKDAGLFSISVIDSDNKIVYPIRYCL